MVEELGQYSSKKKIDIDACKSMIKTWQQKGQVVGLCHGGFDLTHPGHFRHFESAKKKCDKLVVSITADKFVTSRKGEGRPVYTAALRAYMIASCKFVDAVLISPFKLGVEIIKTLHPDIYIKGPDFINKKTPGISAERQAIKEIDGKIEYTNELPMSTTKIIHYIKNTLPENKILIVVDRDGTLILNNDFPGKDDDWLNGIKLKKNVVSFLSFLQTRYATTTIVVSNQAGVARGLFSEKRVHEVNNQIESLLSNQGITIDKWTFCPDVDLSYAKKHPEISWDTQFVKEKTSRKPAPDMTISALEELKISLDNFCQKIVIGDRIEDQQLANSLNALFFDATHLNLEESISRAKSAIATPNEVS